MAYPDTSFTVGEVDAEFGGQPANRYGVPQHAFRDAQIRELQRQAQDQWWQWRPVQYLPMATSGIAGDVVVFDSTGALISGLPTWRALSQGGYTQDVTPIVGVLLEPVSAGFVARVCPGGGVIAPNITGLSSANAGEITVDTTTGRLRSKGVGEPTNGYCDVNGNCYLLPTGFTP